MKQPKEPTASHNKNIQRQKGAGLVTIMAVGTMVLGLISLYTKRTELVRQIGVNQDFKAGRDELAKSILAHISNPEYMKNAAESADWGWYNLYNGNRMLKKCLELTDPDGNEPEDCFGIEIDEKKAIRNNQGYYISSKRKELLRLTLAPVKAPKSENKTGDERWLYQFPGERKIFTDKFGQKINCPPSGYDHISCLLAGSVEDKSKFTTIRDPKTVGYNFRGESARLSPCYPLEPVVYINPVCGTDPVTKAPYYRCKFAEEFAIAVEIIHRNKDFFGGETCEDKTRVPYHNMGSYPKKLSFIYQPRHLLAGYQCNVGAYSEGYLEDGNINCQCRFPYKTTGKQNERGVICEVFAEECPDGSVFVGRKKDGSPVCEFMNEMSEVEKTPEITFGTASGSAQPGDEIECSDKGWMKQLTMECVASVSTQKHSVKDDICYEMWFVMNALRGNVQFFKKGKFIYIDDKPWGKGCTNIKTKVYVANLISKIKKTVEGTKDYSVCLLIRAGICALALLIPILGWIKFGICIAAAVIPWVDYSFDCYPIQSEPAVTCALQGHCYKFGDKVRKRLEE